jgi:predicted dithiol-disulfide oxidoreductase (DUF899 family)
VTRAEWLVARQELLTKEKELTHRRHVQAGHEFLGVERAVLFQKVHEGAARPNGRR